MFAGHETTISDFRKRAKEEQEQNEAAAATKRQEGAVALELQKDGEDDEFKEATGGKRRSAVWQFYKVSSNDSGKVENTKCKLGCDAEPVKYPGNTTNMRSHLSSVHKNEYCKMIDAAASVSDESTDGDPQDRRLDLLEWDIVKESAYFFTYVKNDATDLRQGTLYPTASLILPILGKVAYYAEAVTTPLKFEKRFVTVITHL
eukprot:gene7930-9420_t